MYFTTIKPVVRRPLGFYHSKATISPVQNKPLYNVRQNESGWNLDIALPGFVKEEIQINVKQDQLIIKAVPSASEDVSKTTKSSQKEFIKNEMSIQFHLSDKMDSNGIQARLDNGILNIFIPSTTPAEPSAVRIEVK